MASLALTLNKCATHGCSTLPRLPYHTYCSSCFFNRNGNRTRTRTRTITRNNKNLRKVQESNYPQKYIHSCQNTKCSFTYESSNAREEPKYCTECTNSFDSCTTCGVNTLLCVITSLGKEHMICSTCHDFISCKMNVRENTTVFVLYTKNNEDTLYSRELPLIDNQSILEYISNSLIIALDSCIGLLYNLYLAKLIHSSVNIVSIEVKLHVDRSIINEIFNDDYVSPCERVENLEFKLLEQNEEISALKKELVNLKNYLSNFRMIHNDDDRSDDDE